MGSKIAVLSGKGGTGKTLVSVNLASVTYDSIYIDCDVEEPNGHLFFKPKDIESEKVTVKIPEIDNEKCDGCRKCIDFCRFNALAYINSEVKVFEGICHSCGGCQLVCPNSAISEKDKVIGRINKGFSGNVSIYSGELKIGEVSGVPIIRELLNENKYKNNDIFIDCPPGSACVVMESIKDSDYCVLVAEPTSFGIHNLKMVYELVKIFKKPYGIVINKYIQGEDIVDEFCAENNIKILAKIPYDRDLGEMNSNGEIISTRKHKYKEMFLDIYKAVKAGIEK